MLGTLVKTRALTLARIQAEPDADDALLEQARARKSGAKFRKLFDEGDISAYGNDASKADMALARLLCNLCGNDPQRIERLMRRSKLARPKWDDHPDYLRERTIDKVCEDAPPPAAARPVQISVRAGQLPEAVDATVAALTKHVASLKLYVNNGRLVRPSVVIRDGFQGADGKPQPVQCLELCAVSQASFAVDLNRIIAFRKGKAPTNCPPSVTSAIFGEAEHLKALPQIERISETPVFDGTRLYSEPGLHGTTWVNAPQGIALPATLSREVAQVALDLLSSKLEEFPFQTPVDRAVAIALLMTAVQRASLATAPGFLITKPSYGAGATFLSKLAGLLATGREPAVMPFTDEQESRKQLNAALIAGRSVLIIDNLPEGIPLSNPLLAQLTSETTLAVRELGTGREPVVDCRRLVIGTGVSVTVGADLTRRFLSLCLDPMIEAPESRTFRHPELLTEVQAERVALLNAAFTITAAYLAQAERVKVQPLAGYGQWTRRVAEPLVWLDEPDIIETSRMAATLDDKTTLLLRLFPLFEQLHQMPKYRQREGLSTHELMMDEFSGDSIGPSASDQWDRLRHALREVLGEATKARIYEDERQLNPTHVGRWLFSVLLRVVEGKRLENAGIRQGTRLYRVRTLDEPRRPPP